MAQEIINPLNPQRYMFPKVQLATPVSVYEISFYHHRGARTNFMGNQKWKWKGGLHIKKGEHCI